MTKKFTSVLLAALFRYLTSRAVSSRTPGLLLFNTCVVACVSFPLLLTSSSVSDKSIRFSWLQPDSEEAMTYPFCSSFCTAPAASPATGGSPVAAIAAGFRFLVLATELPSQAVTGTSYEQVIVIAFSGCFLAH